MAQKSKINKRFKPKGIGSKVKIEKIKKAISEGSYKVHSEKVAEKIIELHLKK